MKGHSYFAAGAVAATKQICNAELKNAFVFTGFGDHHASSTFYGDGCYFSGAAIGFYESREKFGMNRFAIIIRMHTTEMELGNYSKGIRMFCIFVFVVA